MDFDDELTKIRNRGLGVSTLDVALEKELSDITDGSIQTFSQVLKVVPNGVFIYMQPRDGEIRVALQMGNTLCKIDNFSVLDGNYPFLSDSGVSDRLKQYMNEDLELIIKTFKSKRKLLPHKIWIAKNNGWREETPDYTPPTKDSKRTTFGFCGKDGAGDVDENFNNWRYSLEDKGWQSLTNI